MKSVSISGSPRANVGKKDAKELRRQGLIPCVIYGGKEQVHFSAPESQFKKLVYTPEAHTVKLDVDGKQFDAIMQEAQFHRISDKLLHIDFLQILPGKPAVVNVPVHITGNAPGVKAGGKLLKKLRTLRVRGLIENLPESITLKADDLEIGDSIKVLDIKRDGIEFLDTPNATVIGVRITRNVAEEEAPAAAAAAGAAPAAGAAGAPAAGAPGAAPAAGAAGAAPAAGAAAKKPDAKK